MQCLRDLILVNGVVLGSTKGLFSPGYNLVWPGLATEQLTCLAGGVTSAVRGNFCLGSWQTEALGVTLLSD